MDRRSFLKVTGTAAMAGVAGTAIEAGRADAAPSVPLRADARILAISVSGAEWLPGAAESLARIGHRLAIASSGAFALAPASAGAAADGSLSSVDDDVAPHPAFAFFGGLPGKTALPPDRFSAWLRAGGGQMLWDDLAADAGWKPLWAGHAGAAGALWLTNGASLDDWEGLRIGATGLLAATFSRLGARPVAWTTGANLDTATVDALAVDAPTALATGLCGLAKAVIAEGVATAGTALVLRVGRAVWDGMTSAEQRLIQMAAADEVQAVLAEQVAHASVALSIARQVGVAEIGWRPVLRERFDTAAAEIVASLAETDEQAGRIATSYRAISNGAAAAV
jgi:TRAP-type mannitol/chloroaromatic compound transport system substrate-binding protein